MARLYAAVLAACAGVLLKFTLVQGQAGSDDTVENFELLEDFMETVSGSDRGYSPLPTATAVVDATDGSLRVDVIDNPDVAVGGSWLRARGAPYRYMGWDGGGGSCWSEAMEFFQCISFDGSS
jgi:hypothetical protein